MKCVEGGVEAETHQVLKNMGAILENAGLDFSNGIFLQILSCCHLVFFSCKNNCPCAIDGRFC